MSCKNLPKVCEKCKKSACTFSACPNDIKSFLLLIFMRLFIINDNKICLTISQIHLTVALKREIWGQKKKNVL